MYPLNCCSRGKDEMDRKEIEIRAEIYKMLLQNL
jgi:hypothetical protein